MPTHETHISRADESDLDGILELQADNQIAQGGSLSASLPCSRVAQMMNKMPLIVSRCDGRITGFLMATTRAMNADLPLCKPCSRLITVRLTPKSMARSASGREGVLFIRRDNQPSLRTHLKWA